MDFLILIKPSTKQNLFQTRGTRSLPGANKTVVSLFLSSICLMPAKSFVYPQVIRRASWCTGNSCSEK